jgi:thioesterase domain-containing protein/acyl carrier protein
MVPTAITVMDKMPLTPAGKIDRKALPRPESIQLAGVDYTAPRTELETLLAQIWESFLPAERIGIHDNFFELGGHSLIGVRMVARINKELDTQLQVAALLTAQTIDKLAQLIEKGGVPVRTLIPLASSDLQQLFLIHPVGGDVLCYSDLAQALKSEFSVYGLRARGLEGQPVFDNMSDMVEHYVHEIRAIQPKGPFRIAGQSLGGIIALAVARQLESEGEQVDRVFLLDTFSPNHLRQAFKTDADVMAAAFGRNPSNVAQPENVAGSEDYERHLYRTAVGSGMISQDVPEPTFKAILRVAVNNHRLASQTEVESLRANVHHFTAQDNPAAKPSGATWQGAPLNISFHKVAGGHETLMQGVNAAPLARLISNLCK